MHLLACYLNILVLCFYNFKYRVRYLRDIKPKTSLDNHSHSTFQSLCVNCRTETHCGHNHLNTLLHYISFLATVTPTAESKLSNWAFRASIVPHTNHSKCSVCCDDVAKHTDCRRVKYVKWKGLSGH